MTQQLTPGSPQAQKKGCRCPVLNNHYGKGVPTINGPQFWINGDCPLHGVLIENN